MTEHNLLYFRNLWQDNTSALESHCKVWEEICSDSPVPDDVHGEIRTTIGLARLLMNQKLKQFKGLIDDSEFHTGEKEITCTDLEGFWDMVYSEVEKIQNSFNRLEKCKHNDWKFVEEIPEKPVKKAPVKKDVSVIKKKKEISKAQILAARQRIAEAKKKMAAGGNDPKNQNQIDILLPNKKVLSENNTAYESVMNRAEIDNNTVIKEKRKPNHEISRKKIQSVETNDLLEETSDLNNAPKQKSAQKKKYKATDKENVFLNNGSSDMKQSPAKQAKTNEPAIQEQEKIKKIKNYGKLQCITRSAAKKALLLQKHVLEN